mmetsp:Transcript_66809/g.118281  ORF Transcript_66809/g.118281 Transcript_66809/m.118281 type:complete len:381 (+) Transcript_66809:143-1285(+)
MPRNPYIVLGVQATADDEEIRKAYRSAALQCHPDKRPPEDRDAAEQLFKDLGQAYDILRDPEKRRAFDVASRSGHCHGDEAGGLAASTRRRRRPSAPFSYPSSRCSTPRTSASMGTPRTPGFQSGRNSGFGFTPDSSPYNDIPRGGEGKSAKPGFFDSAAPRSARPVFGGHVWFARGSACVGRAYKGQEAEELALNRQKALLAAADWVSMNPPGECLLELRGCASRGEVALARQESLAKTRCEKALAFLTESGRVALENIRTASVQLSDTFQGVEIIGMRRLSVNGAFLSDGSLLLSDENVLPAVTKFLMLEAVREETRMLFFEVIYPEDGQRLAQRRKAALFAALSSSGKIRSKLGAGVRQGKQEQVIFYTYEVLPDAG